MQDCISLFLPAGFVHWQVMYQLADHSIMVVTGYDHLWITDWIKWRGSLIQTSYFTHNWVVEWFRLVLCLDLISNLFISSCYNWLTMGGKWRYAMCAWCKGRFKLIINLKGLYILQLMNDDEFSIRFAPVTGWDVCKEWWYCFDFHHSVWFDHLPTILNLWFYRAFLL